MRRWALWWWSHSPLISIVFLLRRIVLLLRRISIAPSSAVHIPISIIVILCITIIVIIIAVVILLILVKLLLWRILLSRSLRLIVRLRRSRSLCCSSIVRTLRRLVTSLIVCHCASCSCSLLLYDLCSNHKDCIIASNDPTPRERKSIDDTRWDEENKPVANAG